MLKPDDKISVEMTALEGCMLKSILAYVHGDYFNDVYDSLKFRHIDSAPAPEALDLSSGSKAEKFALAQFENPNQSEIDRLEATIKNAASDLAKLKVEYGII